MSSLKRITKVYNSSDSIPFDDTSRIILMSDCHRGDGSWADNFTKNQHLYFAALSHYYNEGFTYIELGDGDELWENNKLSDIINVHKDAFWMLSQFFDDNRLYFIYGNHDMVKKSRRYVRKNMYEYFDERKNKNVPLFMNIKVHQGLILRHKVTEDEIFLIHGHQGDWLNDRMWRLARFLVNYLWKPLELIGVNDPTRTAKNYRKKEAVRSKLAEWAGSNRTMLIAGHTHRPVFPEVGEAPYFNDGSCVHPRCITGIEIADGCIMLVKWSMKTRSDGTLFVGRDILAGPRKLRNYFNIYKKCYKYRGKAFTLSNRNYK